MGVQPSRHLGLSQSRDVQRRGPLGIRPKGDPQPLGLACAGPDEVLRQGDMSVGGGLVQGCESVSILPVGPGAGLEQSPR